MAEAHSLAIGNDFHQVCLDFVRVGFFRKTQTLREAHDMGVDANGLLAEGVT
jgi:hypothetical protein